MKLLSFMLVFFVAFVAADYQYEGKCFKNIKFEKYYF